MQNIEEIPETEVCVEIKPKKKCMSMIEHVQRCVVFAD